MDSQQHERRVRWKDLLGSGSDIDLDSLDVDKHHLVLEKEGTDGCKKKLPLRAYCLQGLAKICPEICTPMRSVRRDFVPGETPVRIRGKVMGHLWKLCAGIECTPENLSKIESWRRRLFMVEETTSGLALVYMSEKSDGLLLEAALLRGSKKGGKQPTKYLEKLEELPNVTMEEASHEDQYRMMSSLKQYEIAFFGGLGLSVKALPETLHPIDLVWKSEDGEVQRLVLATAQASDRRSWIANLNRLTVAGGHKAPVFI
mmetsp:Transcript_18827/g.35306  ORF Transcript_18827/g.35306 Transcript_18827/m.35306 type:complete len:258 (+) Transcript_18827:34-807(+)